jgi:peptide methionine sulfoxide reductase msrA/msrB
MPSHPYRELSPQEKRVIIHKGTEAPFTGKFNDHKEKGIFTCRQCETPLYASENKFKSGCGWPSFDDHIAGAVTRVPDADGMRVEIICSTCQGHLGHVFEGERMTAKNTRHCVNSVSMDFIPSDEVSQKTEVATFASGCFWGVQYHLAKVPGVLKTSVGYIGGHVKEPSYREVCQKTTGHAEAIEVTFNPAKVDYSTLAKLFFETHDPTQVDGQGPDIGPQYRSEVFYHSKEQKEIIKGLFDQLSAKGLKVATQLSPISIFWDAEEDHQHYYEKTGGQPYCHRYQKRF